MASLFSIFNSLSPLSPQLTAQRYRPQPSPPPPCLSVSNSVATPRYLRLGGYKKTRIRRGISVVTRAGPSSTSYIFAFVFPLSLLAVTIFASMRVADKLDQKFLEELAVNQAILEGNEDDGNGAISTEEEPPAPRTRNRPKREVEPSST